MYSANSISGATPVIVTITYLPSGSDLSTVSNYFLSKPNSNKGTLTVSNLIFLADNWVNGQLPLGNKAFSAGYGLASGANSIAIGNESAYNGKATADGDGAIALGAIIDSDCGESMFSHATGKYSVAIQGGLAIGKLAIAIGGDEASHRATASGENSIALGAYAEATGKNSFALGNPGGSGARGERSIALGGEANGKASLAVSDALAYGAYSVAMADSRTFTSYFGNVSAGGDRLDDGGNSVAFAGGRTFGRKCFAFGGLTSIGQTNYEVNGYGKFTAASNDYTVAIGMGSVATGIHSMALMGGFAFQDNMTALGGNFVLEGEVLKDLLMGGNKITNLSPGTASSEAATIGQLDQFTDPSSARFDALTNALKKAGIF